MAPPPARLMAGIACLATRNIVSTLTCITRRHSSSPRSTTEPRLPMPTLLSSRSSRPKRSTAVLTMAAQSADRVTSTSTAMAWPPTDSIISTIGRATAEIIGREGGTVVLVDTDKAALDETTGAIRARGGAAHALAADALDAAQVESVVRRTVQEHKRIDILVNAVGGSTIIGKPAAPIDELTLPDWQQLLHFNLTGTFLFCHAVVPVIKRHASGKIVNITAIAGRGLSASSSAAYASA